MKSYKLVPSSGKIASALCRFCAEGEIGESLFREGINQASFCLFLARLAESRLVREGKAPLSATQLADVFNLVSGGNSSAAQKALGGCGIQWEATDKDGESILDDKGNPTWNEKQQSVEAYWAKTSTKSAANLSILDA